MCAAYAIAVEASLNGGGPQSAVASALVDALAAGVLATTADGVVTLINPCAARILKLPPEEVLGRNVGEVLAPIALLSTASDASSGDGNELRITAADGATTTIGFSVSVFSDAESPRYVILFRDISPILQLRKQRAELMQMAALGNILPAILHELRNPLAAVTAMLEVMIEENDGPIQTDLHALLWELRRMHLNLQGVGGFSRSIFTTGHMAVDSAITEACRILSATAERKGVAVECDVADMPLLPLDRSVLNGVVFNLVTNAIDASARGSSVVVRAKLADRDSFLLEVEDSGRGMSRETLDRCCDLFFTSKDGGSGIGLALCQEAATRAAGTLDIKSEPGVGTKVSLTIPLKRKNQRTEKEVTNVTSR